MTAVILARWTFAAQGSRLLFISLLEHLPISYRSVSADITRELSPLLSTLGRKKTTTITSLGASVLSLGWGTNWKLIKNRCSSHISSEDIFLQGSRCRWCQWWAPSWWSTRSNWVLCSDPIVSSEVKRWPIESWIYWEVAWVCYHKRL